MRRIAAIRATSCPACAGALLWSSLMVSTAGAQGSSVRRDSAALAPASVVPLHNGPNDVDLLGDGHRAMIFVARRDNANAHGHVAATFYLYARSEDLDSTMWLLVPFFKNQRPGAESLGTEEGADCTLSDLRLLRLRRGTPLTVVVAQRELGASYADSAPVRFDVYRLKRNDDKTPGWPRYYFAFDREIRPSRSYCDVDDAFARELGLGPAGLDRWDGPRE